MRNERNRKLHANNFLKSKWIKGSILKKNKTNNNNIDWLNGFNIYIYIYCLQELTSDLVTHHTENEGDGKR